MITVRSLPLRVAPVPGEALDSWLETLAHQHHARFGDLLHHLGIETRTRRKLLHLTDQELDTVSAATGIKPNVLRSLTPPPHRVTDTDTTGFCCTDAPRHRPPRQLGRSRFCPACLEATQGRWQLAWRSQWVFACTLHRCLLADNCPSCGHFVRTEVHRWSEVPLPAGARIVTATNNTIGPNAATQPSPTILRCG